MTTDPKDQKPGAGFEQDLEALRSAWSSMDQAEPPDLLDQAILNSAARALESQPLPWWKKRPLHWAGAAATAMVLVLTITLVVRQDPMAPSPAMLEQGPMSPSPSMLEQDGLKQDRDDSALSNKNEVSADAVEFRRERMAEDMARSQEIAEPAAKMAKRVAAPAPPQANLAAAPALEEEVADRPAELSIMADSITTPDEWVTQLLELKAAGKEQELKEQLAAFRAAYPDYALPPELQD